uniref:7TM_GPCR_Srx domain-containing protein n=1 Tax=Panagrellus redivivus TaxID=6233 RepID=A0A7E4ZSF1_PANRE
MNRCGCIILSFYGPVFVRDGVGVVLHDSMIFVICTAFVFNVVGDTLSLVVWSSSALSLNVAHAHNARYISMDANHNGIMQQQQRYTTTKDSMTPKNSNHHH